MFIELVNNLQTLIYIFGFIFRAEVVQCKTCFTCNLSEIYPSDFKLKQTSIV